ncbi:helix-turn-helix domain-containing protein [Pseudoxanthomonas japonensis]|uniref:helix-turn-helix domain-containing protein n=1 Tax=Pseudoxanthomonas japonensis TaxID=69284 RepID=UPI001BCB816A|nr:XRE family transcriptional regulator [Pseudoxanthomonas japonensis]
MSVLEHVAENIRRLRADAGLSQQALSVAADVSRRMLVGIESGDANVSLNTLDRIAEALKVTFADLVKAPSRPGLDRIEALAWSGRVAGSQGVLLATAPASHDVELWAWTLMPGDRYVSAADPAGWHEMFFVIEGCLVIELPDSEHVVAAGDFFVFPSDRDYAYRNDGDAPLRFIRNVVH